MDQTAMLGEARAALMATAERVAGLVRAVPDPHAPIPGSEWTIREAAIHVVNWEVVYADIATGMPSPVENVAREAFAADSVQRIADVPESDPDKLAELILDGIERFLDVTAGRPGDQPVTFHCGLPTDLATLACISLGEHVLHGFDLSRAAGVPWPIDPGHAGLILAGYAPAYSLVVNPVTTRELTVAYEIELRSVARFTVRFVGGEYRLEPAGSGAVDCTISADPVAYLLTATGRLSQWDAIALGLLSAGGTHPELALGFGDLFVFP